MEFPRQFKVFSDRETCLLLLKNFIINDRLVHLATYIVDKAA